MSTTSRGTGSTPSRAAALAIASTASRSTRTAARTSASATVTSGPSPPPASTTSSPSYVPATVDAATYQLLGVVHRLLDGNLAVERTRNVTAGGGGKAADDAAQAREHLMTRSFTHGRIVTHDDVLRAVLALGNVVQARLDPLAPAGLIGDRRTRRASARCPVRGRGDGCRLLARHARGCRSLGRARRRRVASRPCPP